MGHYLSEMEDMDKPSLTPDPQVRTALDRLDKRIAEMQGITETLLERMNEALRPSEPRPAPNGANEIQTVPRSLQAPLAEQLSVMEMSLGRSAGQLKDVLDRLEL